MTNLKQILKKELEKFEKFMFDEYGKWKRKIGRTIVLFNDKNIDTGTYTVSGGNGGNSGTSQVSTDISKSQIKRNYKKMREWSKNLLQNDEQNNKI